MARLLPVAGGEPIRLLPEHVFGKAASCHTVVQDVRVSAQHASVHWSGSAWFVKDLASKNGTFVDERRLPAGEKQRLSQGNVLRLGPPDHAWVVVDDGPAVVVARSDAGEMSFGTGLKLELAERFVVERATNLDGGASGWALCELEGEGRVHMVNDGARVTVGDEGWTLHLPMWSADPGEEVTSRTMDYPGRLVPLSTAELDIEITRNWSYIHGVVKSALRTVDLGAHSYMELIHLLARARIEDPTPEGPDAGWVYVDQLIDDLKWARRRLNVEVWRVRDALLRGGVADGQDIVERRVSTGEIRIGVHRLTIRTI